jgi:WS/DGAT/MGAT family acyltransferase
MQQLTSLDAMFLALESDRNYGHVGSLAILDPSTTPEGKVTLDGVKQLLDERLHLIPPFTSRLAKVPFNLDWPYWVPDDHFDLGYHVRELALPEPGSMEQLAEQTARIYSRRLDRSRPLWELYLIHGLPEGRVALVTKIHHSAVDGMSGSEILTLLYDLTPEPRAVEPPSASGPATGAPPGGTLVLRGLAALPRWPMTAATRLSRLLPHVDVVPSLLGAPGSETISRTLSRARKTLGRQADAKIITRPRNRPPVGPYGGRVSPHRIFGLGSVSLDDVKRVKNALGVKVNDVIVSITAGAIREHLERHGELPDEPLVAQIPVSVRTEEERGTFGNQVSIMAVPIPTHLADSVERVRFAADVLSGAKERHNALPAKALRDVSTFVPPAVHARAARVAAELTARQIARPLFNVVISNVPGPPMDIYTGGARLEALYPLSVIADGTGLNVTIMSYRDSVDIGITADREQTPDVQTIVDGMRADLDALVAATAPKAKPAPKPRTRPKRPAAKAPRGG